jgi:RNA polymerase primary sigma factor
MEFYLRQISGIKPLTTEEESALAIKIRNGDKKARERLIIANLRFVVSVARNYQNQGMTLPDLVNEGNYGLIKASEKFDESKNFKFISYAVWWIRQAILKALAEQSRMVKIPLHVVTNISDIAKAQIDIEQKKQRMATSQEIASKLETKDSEVQTLLAIGNRHVSLDQPIGDEELKLIDTLTSNEEQTPEEKVINSAEAKQIRKALGNLKGHEEEVIRLYYGIDQENGYCATLEEIGFKLHLTRERIRQIKDRGLKRLKQHKKLEDLKSRIN